MRLEHLEGRGGGVILNDTWNHDLDGLSTALDALERIPGSKRAVIPVRFRSLYSAHKHPMHTIAGRHRPAGWTSWIAVGPELAAGIPGIADVHAHHPDVDALLGGGDLTTLEGWDVLVKGARPFGFERVSNALEVNSHATVLDLDLGRLSHNLDRFRDRFKSPSWAWSRPSPMARGTPSLSSSTGWASTGSPWPLPRRRGFEEAGRSLPILVLNADARRFGDLIEWDLEPEVHRLDRLGPVGGCVAPRRACRSRLPNVPCRIHLKVETGMHRLGLQEDQWAARGRRCAQLERDHHQRLQPPLCRG